MKTKLNYCLAASKLGLTPEDASFLYILGKYPDTTNKMLLRYLTKDATPGAKAVAQVIRGGENKSSFNKEIVQFMADWVTKRHKG